MSQKVAYEISSLLASSGSRGEKSGVFRLLYQTILNANSSDPLFLFSLYPDLLDTVGNNKEVATLLKNRHITLLQVPYYTIPSQINPVSFFIQKLLRFLYRKFLGDLWIEDYKNKLIEVLNKNSVGKVYHGESTYFPVPGLINSITINDLIPIKFPHLCQPKTIQDAKARLAFAKNYANEIICISENTKKDLLEFWGESSKNKNVIVKYPSAPPLTTAPTNHQPLATNHYFLSYGTYEPRKNLLMLCNLFIKLEKENKLNGYKLVLAGGKGWGGMWEEIAALKGPIIQMGFVSDAELSELIKNAKAVLYPTLYEGYGFPVVESRSLGTSVLCSNNSSLPEVCKENCTLVGEEEWERALTTVI